MTKYTMSGRSWRGGDKIAGVIGKVFGNQMT